MIVHSNRVRGYLNLESEQDTKRFKSACARLLQKLTKKGIGLVDYVTIPNQEEDIDDQFLTVSARLIAASKLQESICCAQSSSQVEAHECAAHLRNQLRTVLKELVHGDSRLPNKVMIAKWSQRNAGIYLGPPHAPELDTEL
jgi:hypothetical protein